MNALMQKHDTANNNKQRRDGYLFKRHQKRPSVEIRSIASITPILTLLNPKPKDDPITAVSHCSHCSSPPPPPPPPPPPCSLVNRHAATTPNTTAIETPMLPVLRTPLLPQLLPPDVSQECRLGVYVPGS
ncbi:hypothetical protein BDFG_04155 [Blastomyces dermatitidis ATCC 26199]|nr:hypothetical protein BDFG_04155 [Blastomyces dermatitidis ATCC 26199]